MVKERQCPWTRVGLVVLASLFLTVHAQAAETSIRLTEASQRGTFNVGAAQASVAPVADPTTGGDVLKFDFTIPQGTAAGVWTKGFPKALDAETIDIVRSAVKSSAPLESIAVTLEIKGAKGVQRIPLELSDRWTPLEQFVDWQAVGGLNEIVVSVSRIGTGDPIKGTLDLDIRFEALSPIRKVATNQLARIGGIVVLSLLIGGVISGLRRVSNLPETDPSIDDHGGFHGLKRDLCLGIGTAGILGLGIAVDALATLTRLEIGWNPLLVAIAGAIVAEWLSFGLTGRHLSTGQAIGSLLATGLPAASASGLSILQAPAHWSEMLMLSQTVAMLVVLIYHGANAQSLATSRRPITPLLGAAIVATPYVVGLLVLLQANGLVESLGSWLSVGLLAKTAVAPILGRILALFLFNEIVTNGLSLATKQTPLRSWRSHLSLVIVATGAVLAFDVAAWGSGETVASYPEWLRWIAVVASTVVSQGALWAEVYLLTGLLMDAIRGEAPSPTSIVSHPILGLKKGMVYSGVFMGLLNGLAAVSETGLVRWLVSTAPAVLSMVAGMLIFPLLKTIIETFDGSHAFFARVRKSYRSASLYFRGAVIGLGVGHAFYYGFPESDMLTRVVFGFIVGLTAFAGVNAFKDLVDQRRGRGRVQSWRVYLVQGLLGGAIGAAIGFYFDTRQVEAVVTKYHRYVSAGHAPEPFAVYPLVSKWGFINLGTVSGGVSLLFAEALAGVISWAVPAWLFAFNRTFMAAYFLKETAPIRSLFTKAGLAQLGQNMIEVLRWGLWMSPIINSFLRPMGEPTWYNQDGAIRTVVAVVHDATSTSSEFRDWSLRVFIALLAHDAVRIAIWLDHMGLRVATLVNLSFLGMDRLDTRLARFLAPASTSRCIPEGVKRFTTWAPLLIPFYIPRGQDWDKAWSQSQTIIAQEHGGLITSIIETPPSGQLLVFVVVSLAMTAAYTTIRQIRRRPSHTIEPLRPLANTVYEVDAQENGAIVSRVRARDYDINRRSYDLLDPAGCALFLVDGDEFWPLIGNVPKELAGPTHYGRTDDAVTATNTSHGVRARVEITLAGPHETAEIWTIHLENLTSSSRSLKVVPYLEWVLNKPDADRGHTQYNRLFAEMEYSRGLHAVLAWDKHSKAMGILAADVAPEGFLTSRIDFIGRARSLWTPRVLETLAFVEPMDTDSHPTFDPIGSLLLNVAIAPHGSTTVRLLIGYATDKASAIALISRGLAIPTAGAVASTRKRKETHAIRHGEIPPGTPQPYVRFDDDGRSMVVETPFTPRPFDHTMSNALGHAMVVTNRGLHTSSSVNAQQNRITPDWSDIVTREVPGEAFYLYDTETGDWFSPAYHPTNDSDASNEVTFSVDGSATFRMTKGTLATELTVFVPPDEPAGVYRLTIRNQGSTTRRLRVAPYFQIVLAGQPEFSGPLEIRRDASLNAIFFENPRNTFRTGPAFVAISCPTTRVETVRGRFFGEGRSLAHPYFVSEGQPEPGPMRDDRPIAAFLAEVVIPSNGETTIVVVLGQADDRARAVASIRKLTDPASASAALDETRRWWLDLMDTVRVETDDPEFDRYLDWLKYQALAERIWARRGFYQASGAFGFRDQLQDSVNLIWVDPSIARRQILLHASQQFRQGDVVHWFHRLQDGRTGFVGRSHASDNLLWLGWAVVDYLGETGDESILDESTPYLESELPFPPLPEGKAGAGFDPLRSSREDTVYHHCMRAIDLVLDHRMGVHGIPLMGTGDWNDGLDEIGSEGRGESVWLGFFLYYILDRMIPSIGSKEGAERRDAYVARLDRLKAAIETTWRGDRYLRAFHDDGTEIGVKGSGIWEIDALTASWAVMSGINPERGRIVFETALATLEREKTILLGWPPLREDTEPYLGRSSWYPEGVRENGMYCHGVQWLVGAARILSADLDRQGRADEASHYRDVAYRLWMKIAAIQHAKTGEIETYGGQPNQQAADMVTTFEPGRMIWNGYTGAAGWVFRQAIEGVLGMKLVDGTVVSPSDPVGSSEIHLIEIKRDVSSSPLHGEPRPDNTSRLAATT